MAPMLLGGEVALTIIATPHKRVQQKRRGPTHLPIATTPPQWALPRRHRSEIGSTAPARPALIRMTHTQRTTMAKMKTLLMPPTNDTRSDEGLVRRR